MALSRHAPSFPPLRVPARFSSESRIAIAAAHLAPLLACLGSGVPAWVRVLLPFGVLASACLSMRRIRKVAGIELEWLNGRRLRIHSGVSVQGAVVSPASVDLVLMIVLAWRDETGTRGRCMLTRSGVGEEAWRGLRARLRWDVAAVPEST